MREFYDRTGHDINDMLLSCHFHGTECRAEDFKVVSSLYSYCFSQLVFAVQTNLCNNCFPK